MHEERIIEKSIIDYISYSKIVSFVEANGIDTDKYLEHPNAMNFIQVPFI